jgi:hypothetical protein
MIRNILVRSGGRVLYPLRRNAWSHQRRTPKAFQELVNTSGIRRTIQVQYVSATSFRCFTTDGRQVMVEILSLHIVIFESLPF